MIKLYDKGVYLVNGTEIVEDTKDAVQALQSKCGKAPSKEEQQGAQWLMAFWRRIIHPAIWKISR